MKRLLSILLTLAMFLSILPGISMMPVSAEEPVPWNESDIQGEEAPQPYENNPEEPAFFADPARKDMTTILRFTSFAQEEYMRTVTEGTAISDIGLPDTLEAEIETDTGSEPIHIPVQEWYCPSGYDAKPDGYNLVPRIEDTYALGSDAVTPIVRLTVNPFITLFSSWKGIGTQQNPLEIDSHEVLRDFSAKYNDGTLRTMLGIDANTKIYAKLTADIDLSAYSAWAGWTPIGNEATPFYGEFDGDGWCIKGLAIKKAGRKSGLFGVVAKDGVIQSLGVSGAYVEGADGTGIIAGELRGTIRNCYTDGKALSSDSDVDHVEGVQKHLAGRIGGIAGIVTQTGRVEACYTSAAVGITSVPYYLSDIINVRAGGIAGKNSGTIKDCVVVSASVSAGPMGPGGPVGQFAHIAGEDDGGAYTGVYKSINSNNTANSQYGALLSTPTDYTTWPAVFRAAPWSAANVKNSDDMMAYLPYLMGANGGKREKPYLPAHLSVFDGGKGTQSEPFLISSFAHLKYISNVVSSWQGDFSGLHFKMTKDINLSGVTLNPIGTAEYPFRGNFDGGGYAITSMTMNRNSARATGLFGHIDGSSITSLGIENADITGRYGVGAIAGWAMGDSQISRCYVKDSKINSDDIDGSDVGGMAGFIVGTISECYAANLTIKGHYKVGGIAGGANRGTITDCYTTGTMIVRSQMPAGGIAGDVYMSEINRCYSTITISYDGYKRTINMTTGFGGIAGAVSDFPTNIKNNVALNGGLNGADGRCDRIFGGTRKVEEGYNGNVAWAHIPINDYTQSEAVRPYRGDGKTLAELKNQLVWANLLAGAAWEWVNDKLPVLKDTKGDQNNAFPTWPEKPMTNEPSNDGSVYKIKTAAELAWLAREVNDGTMTADTGSEIKTFQLENNIDLSGYRLGEGWTPIGNTKENPFSHIFDGKGHKITGLYINYTGGLRALGLFGYVAPGDMPPEFYEAITTVNYSNPTNYNPNSWSGGAIIRGLGIENCEIKAIQSSGALLYYCGAIAGSVFMGAVEKCWVTGGITGTDLTSADIGGIVGCLGYATASQCWNGTNIRVSSDIGDTIGGIAGATISSNNAVPQTFHKGANIEDCYNTGDIYYEDTGTSPASTDIGGIVGICLQEYIVVGTSESFQNAQITKITDCYTTGKIESVFLEEGRRLRSIGGIAGRVSNRVLDHCYHPSVDIVRCAVFGPPMEISGTETDTFCFNNIVGSYDSDMPKPYDITNTIYWDEFIPPDITKSTCSQDVSDPCTTASFQEKSGTVNTIFTYYGIQSAWNYDASKDESVPVLANLPGAPQPDLLPFHLRKGSGGTYVPGSTFYIRNLTDLNNIRTRINDRSDPDESFDIVLEADIALSVNTTPIGNNDKPFIGTFDGNGHTIGPLNHNGSANGGFFGVIKNATVKNLGVIVGTMNPGATDNNAGGIAGKALADNNKTTLISGCFTVPYSGNSYVGYLSNSANAGGIVGLATNEGTNNADITIENCYSSLPVRANKSAGGLVGKVEGSHLRFNLEFSYAAGSVTSSGNAGGILGRYGQGRSEHYLHGNVAINSFVRGGSYSGIDAGQARTGVPATEYIDVRDTTVWKNIAIPDRTLTYADYTKLDAEPMNAEDFYNKSAWGSRMNGTSGAVWSYTPENMPVPSAFAGRVEPMPDYLRDLTDEVANDKYDEFEIWTPSDLSLMSDFVSRMSYKHTFGTYTLKGDLDAGDMKPVGAYTADGMTDAAQGCFRGTFLGENYTISNLNINSANANNIGLFAMLGNGAKVQELTLDNASVTGKDNVGALAAVIAEGASVQNITVSGSVTGQANVGGIAGMSSGKLESVVSSASVNGQTNTGGIAGELSAAGEIADSHLLNTSLTAGTTNTGGIAGNALGEITKSYNLGAVHGVTNTGGIAGTLGGTISHSYMSGSMRGDSVMGGIAGSMTSGSAITNAYSTSNISGTQYVGGIAGDVSGSTISGTFALGSISASADCAGGIAGRIVSGSIANNAALNPSVDVTSGGHRVVGSLSGSIGTNYAFADMSGSFTKGVKTENGTDTGKIALWDKDTWENTSSGFDLVGTWEWSDLPFPLLRDLDDQIENSPPHLIGFAVDPDLAIALTWTNAQDVLKNGNQTLDFEAELQNAEDVTQKGIEWEITKLEGDDVTAVTPAHTIGENNQITLSASYAGRFRVTARMADNYAVADSVEVLVVRDKAFPYVTGNNSPTGEYGAIGALTVTAELKEAYFENSNSLELIAAIGANTATATADANGTVTFNFSAEDMNVLAKAAYPIYVSCAGDASNTEIIPTRIGTLGVSVTSQTIGGVSAVTKVYGDGPFTITPYGFENPIFSFSSDAPDVAHVDADTGIVTILKVGTANITISAAATANYLATSAVCVVTVNKATPVITGASTRLTGTYGSVGTKSVTATLAGAFIDTSGLDFTAAIGTSGKTTAVKAAAKQPPLKRRQTDKYLLILKRTS